MRYREVTVRHGILYCLRQDQVLDSEELENATFLPCQGSDCLRSLEIREDYLSIFSCFFYLSLCGQSLFCQT